MPETIKEPKTGRPRLVSFVDFHHVSLNDLKRLDKLAFNPEYWHKSRKRQRYEINTHIICESMDICNGFYGLLNLTVVSFSTKISQRIDDIVNIYKIIKKNKKYKDVELTIDEETIGHINLKVGDVW